MRLLVKELLFYYFYPSVLVRISKNLKNAIKVFAPATVGNLAVGFDHLGVAIEEPGDEIILGHGDKKGLKIVDVRGANGKVPKETSNNTAGVAALSLLREVNEENRPLEMALHKKMPIGSGMGSSGASASAAVFAVNKLLGLGLTKSDLLKHALVGEMLTTGEKHADNVAPSLLGGVVLIRDNETLDCLKIYAPKGLYLVLVYPNIQIYTQDSRRSLSREVPLKTAMQQAANFASFVSAMQISDFEMIRRSLKDIIIEPQRAKSIPYFYELQSIAMKMGALGYSISGSGPCMFGMCNSLYIAENIKEQLGKFLFDKKMIYTIWVSPINHEGAKLF